ncbi:MAG: hypothetical protein R3D57_07025 [Hyphomicrobiaceae bacterium]
MSARLAAALLAAGFGALVGASGATAQQALHDEVRVGKLSCFSDHYHFGSSKGMSSKKAAEADAAASWSNFVDFEYGSAYASWKAAAGKTVDCAKEGSGTWGCTVSARPCRRVRK